jgi:hypothetical protein
MASGGRAARKVSRKAKQGASKRKVRRTAAQKAASKRNIKKAIAASKRGGKKMRRNGRRRMRRNDTMGVFSTALKVGLAAGLGFVAHKFGTALVNRLIVDKLVSKSVQVVAESTESPAVVSGLGAAQPFLGGLIGGGATLVVGIMLADKFVESQETKRLATAGMVTSFLQTLLVTALESVAPQAAPMLAGGEASRMSAMYGIDPTNIGPRYTPITGVGEYFAQNGMGEYFAQNGMGEYFAQNGLGNYVGNPDIQQAAAGYGELEAPSNYVNPAGDLERELSIVEAAAGVGSIQQAAAGMGNIYQAAAGFGGVGPISRVDTVIPSGQLWAGTRAVESDGNAESPGGILSTSGGEGIFG